MCRSLLLLPALLLAASPGAAAEITCDGAFAADSSVARLTELYGKDNVVTGEVPGPEGTTVIATTVFPNDPAKTLQFGWWNEDEFTDLSYVELPPGTGIAGLIDGMTVKQVEALNGEPFTMTGFWWDYGGYAGFQTGKLAEIPGGCYISVSFEPSPNAPTDIDVEPVSGDREVPSSEPLLEKLDVRITRLSIGYPFPGMEDEGVDEAPLVEDARG
jgi:hypothetical protein